MSQDQAQKVLETAVEKQPKKHGCRRGCFGCLGIVIVLALPVWYFCLHTTPLRVSKETTYILGPMTSDGKRVDYFLAMEERYYPPEIKTDDNGYRLLVRACGVKTESPNPEFYRQQVYEKLGLDPNVKPTLKLESPWKTFEQYSKEHPVEKNIDKMWNQEITMWTFEDFPMLKDWLEENNASIDLLGEAVRKPAFRVPYIRKNENTPTVESLLCLEVTQEFREMSRAAAARAKYRIGTGNIDGAIDDIVTIHHLARHAGKYGTLVHWLVGIAIEGSALDIGIASNPDALPTKAQIERLITEIDALPTRWTWKDVIESERLYSLAALQDMYWGISSFADNFFAPPSPSFYSPNMTWTLDLNIAMTRINETFDIVLSAYEAPAFDENIFTPKPTPVNPLPLLFTYSRSHKIMDTLVGLSVPTIQASRNAEQRLICSGNLHRLTLAVLLYEKEYNKLPEGNWREAVKPYLGANSEQYFRCPACQLAEDETAYALVVGEAHSPTTTPFLIVEVAKPQKFGEGNGHVPLETMEELSKNHDGFLVGNRSGAVHFLPKNAKPEEFRELLE